MRDDEPRPVCSGGTYFAGITAAGLTFHQETRDESPDLMLDAECVRRYLRTCGFSEAQSEEIIADARADQPSTSTTQDLVITSFRQDALQGLLTGCPKQPQKPEWACGRCDTASSFRHPEGTYPIEQARAFGAEEERQRLEWGVDTHHTLRVEVERQRDRVNVMWSIPIEEPWRECVNERRGVWIEEERQKRALWVEEQRQRRESTVDRRVLPVEEERKSPENTVAQSPTNPTPKALFPEPQAPPKDNNEDNERDTNDIKTTQRQITVNMIQARQTPGKQDKEMMSTKTQQRTPRSLKWSTS